MQPMGYFIEWRGVYCSAFYSCILYKLLNINYLQ
nr:MAG TPA: hypothetical protein [Caudoviricetes sp.]